MQLHVCIEIEKTKETYANNSSLPSCKMERFTPAIFIKACHKIIVFVNLELKGHYN